MLSGEASWDRVDEALESQADFLARFAAEQPVQTNEVGRARALASGLEALGRERIDLLELGTSGGLLLYPDRYFETPFEIVRRRGIDRHPVDVTSDDGARLLEAFVWPGQPERVSRLREAIRIVREEPPELIAGDYVELVSELMDDDTVVMSSVTTTYLDDDRYGELVAKLRGTTWLSLEAPRSQPGYDGLRLELNGRALADHVDYHG